MTGMPFRFAVQATAQDGGQWLATTQLAGQPPTTGAQRLAQAEQTIDDLRMLDGTGTRRS